MNHIEARGSRPRARAASRVKSFGASLLGIVALQLCVSAAAQAPSSSTQGSLRVTVLRSGGADVGAVVDPIDAALVRDLAGIAGIDHAQLSPIAYDEIQLTVGCDDQSRACLASIASAAQVGGLVVRSVTKVATSLQLDLVYFDASSQDEPARASVAGNAEQLVAAVPSLVRTLFGIPEVPVAPVVVAPAAMSPNALSTGPSDSGGVNGLTIASIVTLAVGVGVGLAGIIVGASASSTFDDYKNTSVTDRESAQAARSMFDDADSQATVANILMPIGGALVVGGAVMLVIGLSSGSGSDATPQVGIAPLPQGGAVVVSGSM